MVELRHLRYFLAVAEELSFTRAAERLRIAQPPLSVQIRQLEDEVGVALFERRGRPLRLTEAGELLLERTRLIVADVGATIDDVKRMGRGQTGRLSVAFVGSAMYTTLPDILNSFRETHPNIELTLDEMLAAEIAESLRERRIDVGFSRPALSEGEEFEQGVLLDEPLVLAIPERHRFADGAKVAIAELAGEPLIVYPRSPGPSMTDVVLLAYERAGVEATLLQETRHMQTALGLVSAGAGLTFVAASVRDQKRRGVRFVELQEPQPMAPLTIVWRKDSSSVVLQSFLELIATEKSSNKGP
ncbi:LysR family transcriptional regulator [Bradyrhizobium sp. LA6.7]|uniref:LysR family transcriptional regulator n=1 Tax=unclassified Bradyrhizobium TaxID=2631580 RepID=UPI003399B5D0